MPLTFLSPTKCAERVVDELLASSDAKRETLVVLVRQLIRDQYEHCAVVAESYVLVHDIAEERCGLEIAEAIAERIRQFADERSAIVDRPPVVFDEAVRQHFV